MIYGINRFTTERKFLLLAAKKRNMTKMTESDILSIIA